MLEPAIDEIEEIIESAIGELYRGYFRLYQTEQHQRAYDMMGRLLNMLMEDRERLRKDYNLDF